MEKEKLVMPPASRKGLAIAVKGNCSVVGGPTQVPDQPTNHRRLLVSGVTG